jgi:hypothetical protein
MILGNKCDLAELRVISTERGRTVSLCMAFIVYSINVHHVHGYEWKGLYCDALIPTGYQHGI